MSVRQKITETRVGWKEWVALPNLGIPAIKAKVDTGAKTSALHAFDTEVFRQQGRHKVRFNIHPLQNDVDINIACVADLVDERVVTNSGGQREQRLVIQTLLDVGADQWPIEITLTNRDVMRFRMLLGREAMGRHVIVAPGDAYLTGKLKPKVYSEK